MTKAELARALANESDHVNSIAQAKGVIDDFIEILSEALAEEGEVNFPGFGKFIVKTRNARMGRNPHTGDAIEIAEKKVAQFRVGTQLKARIEESA